MERSEGGCAVGDYEEPFSAFPAYGVPSGEFASYYERATLAWYNVARTAPNSFTHDHVGPLMLPGDDSVSNVFRTQSLPAVPAIPWNLNLNRAARAHSADVVVHCPKQNTNDDCNATLRRDRTKQFYTGSEQVSENFVAMAFSGVVNNGTFALSSCSGDGPLSATHRQNIMTIGGEVGCGVANFDGTMITTCDMSNQRSPYNASEVLIASGAHVTDYSSKGQFFFIASTSSRVSSASVVVDGSRTTMDAYAGSSTYVTGKSTFTSTEDCHTYYFEFDDARYPATGAFKT
eukprot:m51a1_g10898 hypothetical protein (289) ;mRNA; f:29261-30564